MTNRLEHAASGRLEVLTRRVYGLALAVLTLEAVIVQVSQRGYFNTLSEIVLVALLASVVAVNISAWAGRANNLMLGAHAAIGLFSVLLLPLMTAGEFTTSAHTDPWVWWNVGLAVISVSIVFSIRKPFWLYLCVILSSWQIVHTSELGGGAEFLVSLQDVFFVFFFTVAIAGMLSMIRAWAATVDESNTAYLESAVERATVDAVEKEDQRINALIHDTVLNVFLLAASAKSPEQQRLSVELARDAAERVAEIEVTVGVSGNTTPNALFRSLRRAAVKACPEIRVFTYVAGSEPIPTVVGRAITEAALQALNNAEVHSKCTKIELKLNSPAAGLVTVHVIDNGRGFRPERVPRRRMGIRGSIMERMQNVGGLAKIKSGRLVGTVVTLRWPR